MPTRSTRSSKSARTPAKSASKSPKSKAKSTTAKASKAPKATKAPARAKRPARSKAAPVALPQPPPVDTRTREKALSVAKAALDKKAENVVLIDVRGLTSIADYFVVMSGSAGRQLNAIAEAIEVDLKKQGAMPLSSEGQQGGNWVLLDYGDVVAHIFETETRGFYDLEGLWADAPRERIEG